MDIRNICLLGHGGSGKTSLVESMLYITGVTDRLGKPADGNTVCDYDPEEIKRQISISLAMTPVMYNGVKINVLDAPGNFDFAGEMQSGVRAAEVGVLVCASKDGLSVGAERGWKYLKEQKKPCIVYVSKEDEENANFSETLAALRRYNFTKAFLGANGVTLAQGFTTPDPEEAAVKSLAAGRAQEVYVLADSSKFGQVTAAVIFPIEAACIITDRLPDRQYRDYTDVREV